jgi:TonB family protein
MLCFAALIFAVALPGLGQTAASAAPGLPKDPREVFAMAAPYYDFADPALKPFHIKATYQLYDEKGKLLEQGTFEYWWASPPVYRATWTRPGATHTDWYTADGKHAYLVTGEPLSFFEHKLSGALFSPLPDAADLDPAKVRLDRKTTSAGDNKPPCFMAIPVMAQQWRVQDVPLGLFPTYCFDSQLPVLRASFSFGGITTGFNKVVRVWGKNLPREVLLFEGKRKILSATVDTIEGLNLSDPALTPPAEVPAQKAGTVHLAGGVMAGFLVRKEAPIYPQDAKDARLQGTVVLQAMIGMDGRIHDLRVVSAPAPSLAESAVWAVSHWEYKPYLLAGQPVEIDTTINVIFTLGG